MKILVSGDPHVKISTIETGKRFLAFLADSIKKVKPDRVVILGDLFDTHAVMRVEVLNAWVRFLTEITFQCPANFQCYLMVGNHDKAGPSSSEHALVGLARFPNVTIVEGPVHDQRMVFLPYYHTFEEFEAALPPSGEILFCHNTFNGAQYENGFYDPNGFPVESVAGFKTVICGHVHKSQKIENIVYVGSPYAFGFQDAGETKGLHVFDTETGIFQRIKTPLPEYRVIEYASPDEFLDNFETSTRSPDDYYKIVVKGDRAAISMMATDERYLSLKSRYKISLAPEFVAEAPRQGAVIQKAATLDGMVETYISDVMETSLDKKRLADYARGMLNG